MQITILQLAKAAGVSVATVSRALSNSAHTVNPETKQRIINLAREMGYQPNQVARSLRKEHSQTIGIITDDLTSPFTPLLIQGIQKKFKELDYFCLIADTGWDPEAEELAVKDLISRSVDGIIFVETWLQAANPILDLANLPYVYVHRLFKASHPHSVIPDELYGAGLAMSHLLGLGHRRIGFITGPESFYSSEDRLTAYKNALAAAGIPFDPRLVERGDWEVEGGYVGAARLLRLPERPTAIFAANDWMALGVIYAAQELGLRVPEDVALVGYDNREIATVANPSITTVTLPAREMGETAAEMLINLLQKTREYDEIMVRGRLIVRESCGAPAPSPESRKLRKRVLPRFWM